MTSTTPFGLFRQDRQRPWRYGDGRGGNGLSLLVKPMRTGGFSKSWSQRVLINGRSTNIGLGAYPIVTLAEARQAVIANRRTISNGCGPRAAGVPTFEEAAEKVIAMHEPTWKDGARSAAIWRSSLRDYAMPLLGRKTVDAITTADVMAVLVRSGARSARRLGGFASRSGDVKGARWNEFEFESATWTVPAVRMKMARQHRVPLSPRAIEILEEARELSDDADLVFPSPTGRMLSDSTISKLVRENGIGCVPHGMRSSFRDWAAEYSVAPREVCELALAHVNNDFVEAAYRRSDLFEHRRELMAEWASYVETSVGTPPPKKSAPWAPPGEDRWMRSGVQGSLGLRSVRTDMPCHAQTLLNLEAERLVESANFGVCAPNLKIDFCAAGSP